MKSLMLCVPHALCLTCFTGINMCSCLLPSLAKQSYASTNGGGTLHTHPPGVAVRAKQPILQDVKCPCSPGKATRGLFTMATDPSRAQGVSTNIRTFNRYVSAIFGIPCYRLYMPEYARLLELCTAVFSLEYRSFHAVF